MPEWTQKTWKDLKDILGLSDGNELVASAEIALSERIASPFYGYFLISWLIINWKIIYVAFFLDQQYLFEKTGLLRNEYLQTIIPPFGPQYLWQFLLEPTILAWAILWLFPYGTRVFYRKSLRNKKALKVIELRELRKEQQQRVELTKTETELFESELEKKRIEKVAASESPELLWENEYKEFEKSYLYGKFREIIESIYKHSGYVSYVNEKYISTDMLAFADTRDLIQFVEGSSNQIKLTPKGKFFASKFLEKNPVF